MSEPADSSVSKCRFFYFSGAFAGSSEGLHWGLPIPGPDEVPLPLAPTPNSFSVPGHQPFPCGHFTCSPGGVTFRNAQGWPLSQGPTPGLCLLSSLLLFLHSEGSRSIEHLNSIGISYELKPFPASSKRRRTGIASQCRCTSLPSGSLHCLWTWPPIVHLLRIHTSNLEFPFKSAMLVTSPVGEDEAVISWEVSLLRLILPNVGTRYLFLCCTSLLPMKQGDECTVGGMLSV